MTTNHDTPYPFTTTTMVELREAIAEAVAAYDERTGDWLGAIGWSLDTVRRIMSPDDGQVFVAFRWSTDHGTCYDCGAPAAYWAWRYSTDDRADALCCVCAADDAAGGTRIARIAPLDV